MKKNLDYEKGRKGEKDVTVTFTTLIRAKNKQRPRKIIHIVFNG